VSAKPTEGVLAHGRLRAASGRAWGQRPDGSAGVLHLAVL